MTPEDIAKLEALAGLHLDDDERSLLAERLERLVVYIRQIESIDSDAAAPLASTVDDLPELREDVVSPSFSVEQALDNAPQTHDSHFRIPSVMPQKDGQDA